MSGARSRRRLPNWGIGLIAVLLVVFGLYLAFTKRLPFSSRGYQVQAVFRDAQSLAEKSPVREAGVNVGEVTKIEPMPESNAALVTMTIKEPGRPIHEDARLQLRPRLFLEGNLFIDVRPGSPSSPELESGGQIPISQTSSSVQLDQILTSLQANVRGNLQLALRSLGRAFVEHGGAVGLRKLFRDGGGAYKSTAYVNTALLGTKAHDLSGLVRNFDRVAEALGRNEPQLKDLVTNLRTVTGSFAAEDQALQAAIRELPGVLDAARPVFVNLNASFPYLRAFSREALPGVRSSGPTLEVATPFIYQLRKLVSRSELRGLVRDLRPTIPQLARLTRRQVPFMEEARALSSCFNEVVIPWSNLTVPANDGEGGIARNFELAGYGLAGIAGESRSGDANGQYIRVAAGGGANTIIQPPPPGSGLGGNLISSTTFPVLGAEPPLNSSARTPIRPGVPCENQAVPDLRSGGAAPGPPRQSRQAHPNALSGGFANTEIGELSRDYAAIYMDYIAAQNALEAGNALRGNRLMADVAQRFREYNREDLPDYNQAVKQLTGVGG